MSDQTALFSLLSLITTTIGGIMIAYIAYKQSGVALKQKEMDAKLELAKIEAKKASENAEIARLEAEQTRVEARKRGAKQSRRVQALVHKTDDQTRILEDTKQHVAKLETQTNGMNERLIREVERTSMQAGIEKGKAEVLEQRRADHAAKNEEHAKALNQLLAEKKLNNDQQPKPVVIVNEEPLHVEITEHHEGGSGIHKKE